MKTKNIRKVSFKSILLRTFAITSVVPILAIGIFMVYGVLQAIRSNTDTLMETNLQQVDNNIVLSLKAYEDLSYQIYTNDDVVELVKSIDEGKDVAASVSQLRRYMNGLLNTKDYVRAITIITEGGAVVTYDTMTAVTIESSWLDNFSRDTSEIYEEVMLDYNMHMYETEYATTFANNDYYLLHMAHRIVNYKKLYERIGMVIISLDEAILSDIHSPDSGLADKCTFIVDANGRILSIKDRSYIGSMVQMNIEDEKLQKQEYISFGTINSKWADAYTQQNERYGWTLVTIIDESDTRRALAMQAIFITGVALGILLLAVVLSLRLTRRLTNEIDTISSGMERAQEGDYTTRIEINKDMPEELETMAGAYNEMIEKIMDANEKEKEANRRHQEAQIAALEAQINPHFLYNTLDTINWMAIEKDEFDISNAINALATILRYAIAKSNAKVTVRDEMEWLKKYIFLQQFRLKDKFVCELDVEPDLMDAPIHKLLMQPFIENAIIHGFEGEIENATVWITMKKSDENIVIKIRDNGRGMPKESVEQINTGNIEGKDRTHIGMGNVITRMKMYYGVDASVKAESVLGDGTTITLTIPCFNVE